MNLRTILSFPQQNFISKYCFFFFSNLLNPDSELIQPLQRPHQLENVCFFFCSFSKFSEIALNFKENFEIFHLQRPHQLETSVFFFCSFSKFSEIALNFKENFEIFHFQRPHQIENVCFFLLFLKIFKNRPKFQRKFWKFPSSAAQKFLFQRPHQIENVCFFFFGFSQNFQKSP